MPNEKLPRPQQICVALQRLGYIERPGKGDHRRLLKKLDHPEGPVTLHTGIDHNNFGRSDVARIRRDTKLEDDDMWQQALSKRLTTDEYDRHLLKHKKADLVLDFWRDKLT